LNAANAEAMLISTLEWRQEFKIEDAMKEEFPEDIFGSVGHVFGKDKEGRPVTCVETNLRSSSPYVLTYLYVDITSMAVTKTSRQCSAMFRGLLGTCLFVAYVIWFWLNIYLGGELH
jgi:hypothetical protein